MSIWQLEVLATAVPKAPVDEDADSLAWKHYVCLTSDFRVGPLVDAEAKARSMQSGRQAKLTPCVYATDALHSLAHARR